MGCRARAHARRRGPELAFDARPCSTLSEITLLRAELENAQYPIKVLEAKLVHQEDMQKALRAEYSFRKAVIEHAAQGVCVFSGFPSSPFVALTVSSQRMTEITGYARKEISPLGWFQRPYPDLEVRHRAIERMERMRKGEDLRLERCEITRADGGRRVLGVSTSQLTAADGLQHVPMLVHDFTEEEHLQRQAMLGRKVALTGIGTLRAFSKDAATLFALALRTGAPSARGFPHLDYLKRVNDSMGHAEGDQVLECVGAMLAECTRSTDVVGRRGGDEFAVLLPDTDAAGARIFFDRLHQRGSWTRCENGAGRLACA